MRNSVNPHTVGCDCANCDPQGQGKYPIVGLLILAVPATLFLVFLAN